MLKGRVESTRLDSRVLKGNRLGDPYVREVLVYLPPTHDEGGRYPTIMILPGFAANHRSVLGYSPWQPNTIERFDEQVAAGDCRPAILVLPDCVTAFGGSQFLDSPATGNYQTYLAEEVLPHIDATFRTIPNRTSRAVIGKSSGGFGALRLGMDRPDVVSVVGSHAGDAAFEISSRAMFVSAAIAIEAAGGLAAFAERVAERGPRNSEFDATFVLAASMAYASRPGAFPYCDLPFDPRTAEIRPEIWEKWLANDPLTLVESRSEALSQLRLVWLDAGNRDEHGLCFAARLLADRLSEVGCPVSLEEYDGGHRGTSHRYEVSLPALLEVLEHD